MIVILAEIKDANENPDGIRPALGQVLDEYVKNVLNWIL